MGFLRYFRLKPSFMYITENSTQPCCLRVVVQKEEKDEKKLKGVE